MKAVLILAFAGCTSKESYIQYVTVAYDQTFCADPWPTGGSDSITARNVAHYLDSLNLYVADVTIKQERAVSVCNTCQCTTGKVIYVSTFEPLRERFSKVGFK